MLVIISQGGGGLHLLNKSSGDDNTSPKVSCKEVDIYVDPCPSDPRCDDWKEGACRGYNENHKECRDAHTESTVIFVLPKTESADHVRRVRCAEINIAWIEG
jgi:hypothetical protein